MKLPDYNVLHIAGVDYESMVDGEGVRTVIFLSGCSHHCKGCQNPQTWDPEYGEDSDSVLDTITNEIVKRHKFLNGITLSGGDPFYSPDLTWNFLYKLMTLVENRIGRKDTFDLFSRLWIYTGYTLEELLARIWKETYLYFLLDQASVLVDGPYIESLRDISLPFRGSSNQRIIDVHKSIASNSVVLYDIKQ